MNKRATLLVASVLTLTGCGGKEKGLELERQKLTLDLMKAQNEQLATLTQKESELRALEKKNQGALQEIERERAELQALQEKTAQKERALQEAVAKEEARLKSEEDRLKAESKAVSDDHLKMQQAWREITTKRAELDLRLAVIEKAQEEARLAKEAERRAEVERKRPEVMERMKRRQPFLEELAAMAAKLVPASQAIEQPRSTVRKALLDRFEKTGVAAIEDEDAFALQATKTASEYFRSITGEKDDGQTTAGALGQAFVRAAGAAGSTDFEKWRQDYLKRGRVSRHLAITPVTTYFAANEMIAFRVAIPDAMRLYKAENGAGPKTHDEFMEKIIKANRIRLPDLPLGQRYVYDPKREELMVEHPQ